MTSLTWLCLRVAIVIAIDSATTQCNSLVSLPGAREGLPLAVAQVLRDHRQDSEARQLLCDVSWHAWPPPSLYLLLVQLRLG